MRKTKKRVWYRKVRGSYLPVNMIGWLTYVPFIMYLIFSAVVSVVESSSMLLAIMIIVPNWMAAGLILTYIATRKS